MPRRTYRIRGDGYAAEFTADSVEEARTGTQAVLAPGLAELYEVDAAGVERRKAMKSAALKTWVPLVADDETICGDRT